jgi:hypothetical protein
MSEKMSKGSRGSTQKEDNSGSFSGKSGKKSTFDAPDWNEAFKNIPQLSLNGVMQSHRKNIETINQAQKMSGELLQSLSTLNNKYVRESLESVDKKIHSFSGSLKNFEKPMATVEAFLEESKNPFEHAVSHWKQATDLVTESTSELFEAYKKRFEEGLEEVQRFIKH